MKKRIGWFKKALWGTAAGFLLAIGLSGQVLAGGGGVTAFNVTEFGANPYDTADDTEAIQRALNEALDPANTAGITVLIPGEAGLVYYVSKPLQVYSDTKIIVTSGVRIISKSTDNVILYGAHVDAGGNCCEGSSCKHGGYTHTQNVSITGGIWENAFTAATGGTGIFSFRHSNNITISDLTCKNATDHFINLSGTANAKVQNVTLQDAKVCQNTTTAFGAQHKDVDTYSMIEGIHLDSCNLAGETGQTVYPLDNTPAKNILVENCTFKSLHAGVGNHHVYPTRGNGITIRNNTFNDLRGFAVTSYGFQGLVMEKNTITNAGGMAVISDSTGNIVRSNSYDRGSKAAFKKNALWVEAKGQAEISGNTIKNADGNAIGAYTGGNAVLSGNVLSGASNHGVYVSGSVCTAKGNKISAIQGGSGIYLIKADGSAISGNAISQTKEHGIIVRSSNKVSVTQNTITNTGEHGITLREVTDATASGNTVSGSTGYAIYLVGSSSVKATATIKDNILSGGKYDIRLGDASSASLSGNKLNGKGLSAVSTASYTGSITDGKTPAPVKLSSVKNSSSKKIKVKWKKSKKKVTGYQIQYAMNKTFTKKVKSVKVKGTSKTSKTISKLKKKKTYYVRIRTYKTVSGKTYYSSWSASKKVKIKK